MNDAQTNDSSGPRAGPAVHVVNPTRKAPAPLIVSSADADNDTTFGLPLQWSCCLEIPQNLSCSPSTRVQCRCVRFPALKDSCESARCGLRHGVSAIARLPSPPAATPSARFRPALSLLSGNRPRFTAGPRSSERSSRAGTGSERWSPRCAWRASAARMRRDAVVSRRPASASASPRVPRRRSPPSQLSSPASPPSYFGPPAMSQNHGRYG